MNIGLVLILAGIVLVVISIMILVLSALFRGAAEVRGAGVILIGPIPIIIGSDKESVKWAVILTIVALAFFMFFILITSMGGW